MSFYKGRALMQGVMILVFAAIALWVSKPVGLALVAFVGAMKLQETLTDWCPSDLFLRLIGLKRPEEAAR